MSEKYKLIKEYPGSPELGKIIDITNIEPEVIEGFLPVPGWKKWRITKTDIRNNPEFWEKVIEEYPIGTKAKNHLTQTIYTKEIDGWYAKTRTGYNDDSINKSKHISINKIERVKQPLFITEDGVEIFEGDSYYCYQESKEIDKSGINYHVGKIQKVTINNFPYTISDIHDGISKVNLKDPTVKRFSTKEAAGEYIIMNKPCLSINDIRKLRATNFGLLQTDLVELVKSRL